LNDSLAEHAIDDSEKAETFSRNGGPHRTVRRRGDAGDRRQGVSLELLSQARVEGTLVPSHQLVRGPNPEGARRILRQRICGQQPHLVVAADASRMLTNNLAEAAAQR
jgi:hypothetical protein